MKMMDLELLNAIEKGLWSLVIIFSLLSIILFIKFDLLHVLKNKSKIKKQRICNKKQEIKANDEQTIILDMGKER